jgi:gliding motility-associated-like protein
MKFTLLKNSLLFSIALLTANISIAQVSAPGAINTLQTDYTSGRANDNIYVFCHPNQATGDFAELTVVAPGGTGPWTFEWRQYNTATFSFDVYSSTTGVSSTISNLPSGGYFVAVTDNGGVNVGCYVAWVFNNETNIDIADITSGCSNFQLDGTADPIADFVYYNPPEEASMIIDNTTEITVCFDATHTYVSDLGFYLISPCGQTVTLSPNPGEVLVVNNTCNGSDDVTDLCFTTAAAGNFDPCAGGTYTGTYDSYGSLVDETDIDWTPLYGCDAASTGWQIQIYDCINQDFGVLEHVSISFSGTGTCGLSDVNYDSGAISSAINDNSCNAATASIFTVPPEPIYTTPIVLANTLLSFEWTSDHACVTIPNPTTDLAPNINPVPDADTWFYLTASDNLGCPVFVDSAQFINTCPCPITDVTSTILPCNTAPETFDITGQIIFNNPPCSGQLTVANCSGDEQVFNAPFVSPINYNLTSIPADATTGCTITANFTNDDALCTGYSTAAYTEPIPPSTASASLNLCHDGTSNVSFDLTSVDATVNEGTANDVTWFTDAATTNEITTPTSFSTAITTTVYAVISNGTCSDTASVYLVLDPLPTANPTTLSLCDQDEGNASFDITKADAVVNGGSGNPITWFTDAAMTNEITTPTSFSTATTTVYGFITDGTCSNTTSVDLVIADVSTGVPATIILCDDGTGAVSFDLTSVDGIINGGSGNIVSWFSDVERINEIATPTDLTTESITVHSAVINGNCTDTSSVFLIVTPIPTVNPTTIYACDNGAGEGPFDLTAADITVNDGTENIVTWFTDAETTTEITSPEDYLSGPTTIYATVADGECKDTSSVYLALKPAPILITNNPAAECFPNTVDLTAAEVTTGTTAGAVFTYFSDPLLLTPLEEPNAVSPTATYYIVANLASCKDTGSVDVTIHEQPVANANVDDRTCILTYNLNAIPSIGTGTWTGPPGTIFSDLNSATSSVTVTDAGEITFTWTEDNNSCTSSSDVTITFNVISIPNTLTNPSCNGGNTGQISMDPQGGTSPYIYSNVATGINITTPYSNLGAGTYTINVRDDIGCSLDSSFTLTDATPFTYTVDSTNANCGQPDGSISVIGFAGGAGPYTYDFGDGPTASNTASNLIPNTYTVTVTDAALPSGCDTSFTIIVLNNPPFIPSIASFTDATCNGFSDGTAEANASDPAATYSYLWDAPANNQTTRTATGLAKGLYTVTITDVNTGCNQNATATIDDPPLVTVTANPASICSGQNIGLTATGADGNGGPYTYNWNPGDFTGSPFNVSPTTTTTYTVIAMDNLNGCPSLPFNVEVTVSPNLIVDTDLDKIICLGDSTTFSSQGSFGNGNADTYIYTWDNGLGQGATQIVSPTVTTTYTVTLDDGCTSPSATDQIIITVKQLPVVNFLVDDKNGCESPEQLFTFHNITTPTDSTLTWSFGDRTGTNGLASNFSPNVDTVTHTYPSLPGSYDVSLTVTTISSDGNCINSLTKENYITIFKNPIVDFTIDPIQATTINPTVYFFDESISFVSPSTLFYAWDIGGLDSSILQNTNYTFPEDSGRYIVSLTITDAEGCENTTIKTTIVKSEFVFIMPNAFTPNGDGLNDIFKPGVLIGADEDKYNFFVFDRWGELLFESHNINQGWDSYFKAKQVKLDVYLWKIDVTDLYGHKHKYHGKVNIVK